MTINAIKSITESVIDTAEFYFCGPDLFMDKFATILDEMGVPSTRRNYEYFGPPKA